MAGFTTLGWAVLGAVAAGGAVGLALAWVAWTRRADVPAAEHYAALMATNGVWCLAYAGVLASPTRSLALSLDVLVTLAALAVPFLWLGFTVVYTGNEQWLTRPVTALLVGEPLAYALLYLTDGWHGLLVADHEVVSYQGLSLIDGTFRAGIWVQVGVMYVAVAAAFVLLARFVLRTRNVHRRQATAILFGAVLTLVGNVVFLSGASLHPALDVTPVFFVLNGCVIAWAFFRYDFLDVAPLARDVLVEAMDDPVVVLDDDDAVVDFNDAAGRRLSLSSADVGRPASEAVPGLLAAVDRDTFAVDTPGGHAVFDPRPTPLTDQYGITRGRLVVCREVTLLKRREVTLAALQSATGDLMAATDVAEVADTVVETAAEVLDHRFAGFLAYDEETDRLRSVSLTTPVAETLPDGQMVYGPGDGPVWDAFQRGELVVDPDYGEVREATYDEIPLASTVLLPLGDHALLGVGSVEPTEYDDDQVRFLRILASAAEAALDRLDRERELRANRDALEERNERLEEFASIVSHDLRTPLTTAKGYLSLATDAVAALPDDVDVADLEAYLGRVDDSQDRMGALIEDLLALARQGAVVDDPSPVGLPAVAQAAWDTAGAGEATLAVADPPSPVAADPERMRTLFENLFANAIEHGGADVTVTVGGLDATADGVGAARVDGEAATPAGFYVADDGPGVPPEERDRVFDQGYSGDQGTGLGLAIVDRIADAHDWTVNLTESDDGGARFEFYGVDHEE